MPWLRRPHPKQPPVAGSHAASTACWAARGAFAYVEAAFKEALRLFPTAPMLLRRLEADTRLGRHALRRGETVAVAVYGMHRNPAYWQVGAAPAAGHACPSGLPVGPAATRMGVASALAVLLRSPPLRPRACPAELFLACTACCLRARMGKVVPLHASAQDPEAFEPERFLAGTAAAAARPAHGWIPFGDGARGCPGAKFGTEEAVLTLVRMHVQLGPRVCIQVACGALASERVC